MSEFKILVFEKSIGELNEQEKKETYNPYVVFICKAKNPYQVINDKNLNGFMVFRYEYFGNSDADKYIRGGDWCAKGWLFNLGTAKDLAEVVAKTEVPMEKYFNQIGCCYSVYARI